MPYPRVINFEVSFITKRIDFCNYLFGNLFIWLSAVNISAQAMEAVKNGELYVCAQADGTITIAADGTVPTCDIPTVIILLS